MSTLNNDQLDDIAQAKVVGLVAALAGKAAVSHTHTASEVTDFDTEVANNSAVTANTAKTGITAQQAADITTNNAKTGITAGQASAIVTNTAKATYPSADSTKLGLIEALADVTDATNVASAGAIIPTGTPDGSKFLQDDGVWTAIPGGGDALVANPLSQFAATTSAQLAGVLSDETGSGAAVFGTAPALSNPTGLDSNDVGLANVDNTSDATKDAATATLTNKTIGGSQLVANSVDSEKLTSTVAFKAYLANDTTSLATSTWVQVKCGAESFDIGSDYSTSTWDFTAPYDGIYSFSWRVGGTSTSQRMISRLTVDTVETVRGDDHDGAANRTSVGAATLKLTAGEVVELWGWQDTGTIHDGVAGGYITFFSGHLVGRT